MSLRKTNEQVISDIMSFAPTGPLAQAFIMEAVARYAKQVAEAPTMPDTPMLSGEAWKRTAIYINDTLNNHFKG